MTDLHYTSAVHVARRIAAGELTRQDVRDHMEARIAAVNERVNAIVDVLTPGSDPEETDPPRSHDVDSSPLAGVPISIKDALHVRGRPSTWGNPDWSDAPAERDSAVVARLKATGCIPIARTNVAMMLADFGESANPLHGATNNPWDLARAPGGSSGGATAAVASGMSFLDYGSDLVGSIRIPAAFCGVYGLRPTPGIVPLAGFQPPGPPAPATPLDHMASLGPIARDPRDLRAALAATAGPDGAQAVATTWNLPEPRHRRVEEFRVGVVLDDPATPVESAVGDVLSGVIDTIASAGVPVHVGWPDGFDPDESQKTFEYFLGAYLAFKQGDAAQGPDLSLLVDQEARRSSLRAVWDTYFADVDVLLCPVTVDTAPVHDERPTAERRLESKGGGIRPYSDLASWIPHASIAGLPSLAAPVGTSDAGLPVGLQIIGPRYEDDTVLAFAEHLRDLLGPLEHPSL